MNTRHLNMRAYQSQAPSRFSKHRELSTLAYGPKLGMRWYPKRV
jgi:hypothetical protein